MAGHIPRQCVLREPSGSPSRYKSGVLDDEEKVGHASAEPHHRIDSDGRLADFGFPSPELGEWLHPVWPHCPYAIQLLSAFLFTLGTQ